jgi:RecA-family ATPase
MNDRARGGFPDAEDIPEVPPKPRPPHPPPGSGPRERFPLVRFADINTSAHSAYTVKGLLPRTGLAVIYGPPKCGKSFLAFDMLLHVALGWEYRGKRVSLGTVVYCALEGALGFEKRIVAFRQKKLKDEAAEPTFYLMAAPLSLHTDHAKFVASIEKQICNGNERPAVVCIDTLNRSLEGSESSDEDMSRYIRAADEIRDAFDCLVVIVHHCGHAAERPRGHSALIGALDVQISVKRSPNKDIVAELELTKDDEAGFTFVSRLQSVDLGPDQDGDPITSCVIVAVEGDEAKAAVAAAKAGKNPNDTATMMKAIARAYNFLADAVETTAGYAGEPTKKVTVEALRKKLISMGMLETDDNGATTSSARQTFSRAKRALLENNTFVERDKLFWRIAERDSA